MWHPTFRHSIVRLCFPDQRNPETLPAGLNRCRPPILLLWWQAATDTQLRRESKYFWSVPFTAWDIFHCSLPSLIMLSSVVCLCVQEHISHDFLFKFCLSWILYEKKGWSTSTKNLQYIDWPLIRILRERTDIENETDTNRQCCYCYQKLTLL